jgi:hypothetical protein
VRFSVAAAPKTASVCHCRMCQKAFGAPYGLLAAFADADLTWTRGRVRLFASSALVDRGFCANCGTPLIYRIRQSGVTDVAVAAFDDPGALAPTSQLSVETRIPFVDGIAALPVRPEDPKYLPMLAEIARTTRQHPDHDTPSSGAGAWRAHPSHDGGNDHGG